jgi:large subunit ribosomal protein L25
VTASDVALPTGAELAVDPELVVAIMTSAPTAEQLAAETGGEVEAPEAAAEEPAEA